MASSELTWLGVVAPGETTTTVRAVYLRWAPPVRRFLGAMLGNDAAADDALQETFARALRAGAWEGEDRAGAWLFGIARNVVLEQRRARRRDGRVPADDHDQEDPRVTCPERAVIGAEAAVRVLDAIATLKEDRRAALLLRVEHGLSYEEIAKLMEWSVSKAKVEVHRARQVLRASLDGEP